MLIIPVLHNRTQNIQSSDNEKHLKAAMLNVDDIIVPTADTFVGFLHLCGFFYLTTLMTLSRGLL